MSPKGRRTAAWLLALSLVPAAVTSEETTEMDDNGKDGFNWLFGRWTVQNRFLVGRLQGSTTWNEFEADYEAWPVLHGWANQDRFSADLPEGPLEGMSLRYFHPETSEWSIHWLDTRALAAGRPDLEGAMRGRITDGVGEFFGMTIHNGAQVLARFVWRRLSADRATWEQAYSADGGTTWEINWIMEFTRVQPDPRVVPDG